MPTTSTFASRLLILQSFKESVWGTGGSATAKWMGVKPYPTFTPYRKSTVFDEVRGSLAPGFNSAILQKGGEYKIDGYVSYEDMILVGHNVFGIVTPTGSTPYTYVYPGLTGSQPNIQSYTFEFNQPNAVVQALGCIGNKLEVKGNASEAMEYSLSGFCSDIDTATGSGITSLSDRAIEVAIMPTAGLWLDPSGSTIGTTAFSNVLLAYSLSIENGLKPIYTAGSLAPSQWVVGEKWKSELTLDLLYTAAVKTFITNTLMAGTQALVRLKATGSGTKYVQFDVAGVLADNPSLFGEKEGAQIVQIKLTGMYNTGASLHTTMTVGNTVSAVP